MITEQECLREERRRARKAILREALEAVEDEVLLGMTEKAAEWNRVVNHCAAAVRRLLEAPDA